MLRSVTACTTRSATLADDVLEKLPDDVPEEEYGRASKLQEQINDLAGDLEESALLENAIEDLAAFWKSRRRS